MEVELEKLNRKPEDFQQEIRKLIQDNQLDLATKRVMDFADDFAVYKKRKYEAIDFQRRYTELREDKRKSSSSEETIREKFSGLTFSVNELMDLLEEISYTQIEIVGHNQHIISASKNVGSNEMIKVFIDNNITFKYFRDISQSTRRLFKTEK